MFKIFIFVLVFIYFILYLAWLLLLCCCWGTNTNNFTLLLYFSDSDSDSIHQTSSKQRKWSIKFKMGAWARTGIWCHTINMNFIHTYIYVGYGNFRIIIARGRLVYWNRDLCVCPGIWVSSTCIGAKCVAISR